MNSGALSVAEFTIELFRRLEQRNFRYAVLRNYERLSLATATQCDQPVTDIDLVMHEQDVPAWRELAIALADEGGWDVLTECGHFAASRLTEHRIEIFRFFRLSPPACLQVDIFHGYLILALPFDTERVMLAGRYLNPQFNLTCISPATENAFRMLQIHSLIEDCESPEKIARYRLKVVEHYLDNKDTFRRCLRNSFSASGERALDALVKNDQPAFSKAMRLSKTSFLSRYFVKHPVAACRYFGERSRDHWLRFMTRQCGFVVEVCAPSDRDQKVLESTLEILKQNKILPAFTTKAAAKARVSWKEHKVMERGGMVVKWAGAGGDVLNVSQAADRDELVNLIFRRFIERHPALYARLRA